MGIKQTLEEDLTYAQHVKDMEGHEEKYQISSDHHDKLGQELKQFDGEVVTVDSTSSRIDEVLDHRGNPIDSLGGYTIDVERVKGAEIVASRER